MNSVVDMLGLCHVQYLFDVPISYFLVSWYYPYVLIVTTYSHTITAPISFILAASLQDFSQVSISHLYFMSDKYR